MAVTLLEPSEALRGFQIVHGPKRNITGILIVEHWIIHAKYFFLIALWFLFVDIEQFLTSPKVLLLNTL